MPTARDLLQRFRPVGAPGAAAPAGVPADRVAELGRELQPVFDQLAATVAEAARIRTDAAAEVRTRRGRGEERAAAVVEAAHRDAEMARAGAAAAVLRRAEQENAAALDEARHEADAVAARAREHSAVLVARVVAAVRESALQPVAGSPR